MGCVHPPLLRPARPEGGIRPPARGGGAPARYLAALLCALALWSATGAPALADTLAINAYRARLREARGLLFDARVAQPSQRDALLERARALLRSTTAITLPDNGDVAIDDGPLADRIGPATIDRELAELEELAALADDVAARRVAVAVSDARLRDLLQQRAVAQRVDLGAILTGLLSRLAEWVYDLVGRPDPVILVRLQGVFAALLAVAIAAVLARGVRERIRRETVLGVAAGDRRADPAVHLAAADAAIRAGGSRQAIHELYLFAIATLAGRETIRYDPALTDHELLGRAAAVPQIGALRDLVGLHERVWFGLREALEPDAVTARRLALEIAR